MVTHFPDAADLLNFTLTITPDEGTSRVIHGHTLSFDISFIQACTRVAPLSSPLLSI